jgi:hypothetical protein
MTQVISPAPGRIVWFYPASHDGIATLSGQPLAAVVAGVHDDRLVNLAVFDFYGNTQQRSNVTLVQPGEERPTHAHATWMPYQIGQASKSQAAEAAVADALTTGTGIVQKSINPASFFAETDGTSASENGLVSSAKPTGVVLTEADSLADLAGTARPDHPGQSSWEEPALKTVDEGENDASPAA